MPGIVTLTFDDGYKHILKDVVPLLDEREIAGVFAIPLDAAKIASEEKLPVASVTEWQTINTRHELAAHSVTHTDLTKLSDQDLTDELAKPQQALSATTLVYPGGAYNDHVLKMVKRHYAAARTVTFGFNSNPPRQPWELKSFNYTRRNWSLLKANTHVLWAWLTNQWVIETFHLISDDEQSASHTVPLQEFRRHLNFIKRLPIDVKTISEVVTPRL